MSRTASQRIRKLAQLSIITFTVLVTSLTTIPGIGVQAAGASDQWSGRPGIPAVASPGYVTENPSTVPGTVVSTPVSQSDLAWVAIGSLDEVQQIDATTGEAYGAPIVIGSGSAITAMTLWQPAISDTSDGNLDPLLAVLTNSTSSNADAVTFVDTLTRQVLSTLSLGGAYGTSIASSNSMQYVVISDSNTALTDSRVLFVNSVSRTLSQTFSDVSTIGRAISQVVFDNSGYYVDAISSARHKIYNFEAIGESPNIWEQPSGSTYTGSSSFDPVVEGSDPTPNSMGNLYVVSSGSPSIIYSVPAWNPGEYSLSHVVSFSGTPTSISVSSGELYLYIGIASPDSILLYSTSSSSFVTNTSGPILPLATSNSSVLALSWDSSSVLTSASESGSPSTYGEYVYNAEGPDLQSTSTSLSAPVTSIATPQISVDSYFAYEVDGNSLSILDINTGNYIQYISDSNDPSLVVASSDGQRVYVLNERGGGTSGDLPQIAVYSSRLFGTSSNPLTATYTIGQSSSSPYAYSLASAPIISAMALSTDNDQLVLVDRANRVLITLQIGIYLPNLGDVSQVSSLQLPTGSIPTSISISPDGSFAFVTGSGTVSAPGGISIAADSNSGFEVSQYVSGSALTDTPPSGSGIDPASLIDPIGIVASFDGSSLWVLDGYSSMPLLFNFPISSNGIPGVDPLPAYAAGNDPTSFSMAPEDSYAYITDGTTGITSAYDLGDQQVAFGSTVDAVPSNSSVTPDGQFFVTADKSSSTNQYLDDFTGLAVYSTVDGSLYQSFYLSSPPLDIALSPVSSSQWDYGTLAREGSISWDDLMNGGSNQAERADPSIVSFVNAGTPEGISSVQSAGVNLNLRSYSMDLEALSVPTAGSPLTLSAYYDSARVTYGLNSSTDLPAFAWGWKLSTQMTVTQNPVSGTLFPCLITVTQADGSTLEFQPSTSIGSTCPTTSYEPLPWEQATITIVSNCSGADSCWRITNLLTGTSTLIDDTNSEHNVISSVDRNGNAVDYTYSGPELSSISESGRTINFAYPGAGVGTCPSSVGTYSVSGCVVATDPLGLSATFALSPSSSGGSLLVEYLLSQPVNLGGETATYYFSYQSNLMTNWWDPDNSNDYPSALSSTVIGYDYSPSYVSSVASPQVLYQSGSVSQEYQPTTTFSYASNDVLSGTGSVAVSDPILNFNSEFAQDVVGGSETLYSFSDWLNNGSVTNYGPLSSTPDQGDESSGQAITERDPLTLMPQEQLSSSADTGYGPGFFGGISFFSYDVLGNLDSQWTWAADGPNTGADNSDWDESTYTYNAMNEVTFSSDSSGDQSTYGYNSTGQLITEADIVAGAAQATTEYAYDAAGEKCAELSAAGVNAGLSLAGLTCSEISSNTSLTSSGDLETWTYDSYGDIVSDTDSSGNVTMYAYDADGNLCNTLNPAGVAAGLSINANDCQYSLSPSTTAPYETVVFSTDLYGNVIESADSESSQSGTFSVSCYDAEGNIVSFVASLSAPLTCSELTVSAAPAGTTFNVYNAGGQLSSSTLLTLDSDGVTTDVSTTTFGYDPDGNDLGLQ